MKRYAIIAALALSACSFSEQSYSPVVAAALTPGESATEAVREIDAFLAGRGYDLSAKDLTHRWYESADATFVAIDTKAPDCISFVAYVKSGSSDFVAAQSISQEFLGHFDKRWAVKREQVC